MCGIIGIIEKKNRPIRNFDEIQNMLDVQKHRGPNDSGVCGFRFHDALSVSGKNARDLCQEESFDGVLGFSRLSIQDLSMNGHQPMLGANGNVILTFNGEIYNADVYRKELEEKGYKFRSTTDTEVILNLYLEYGFEKMIQRLNGMFAIVITDLREAKVYFCRDRFGIKPLYYFENGEKIVFASELKSIIQVSPIPRQLNQEALNEYFTFRSTDNQVLLDGVKQLRPGEIMVYEYGEDCKRKRFFDLNTYNRPESLNISKEELKDRLESKLESCVKNQMVSDVKVGCQLSGGIDSSLVTYFAGNLKDTTLNDSVSIIFENEKFSEEKYIDYVTDKMNINSHKFVLKQSFLQDNLERAIWHLDTIASHPNAIGLLLLTQEAKKYVTVLLSGEGADELMGGYSTYTMGLYVQKYLKLQNMYNIVKPVDNFIEKIFQGEKRDFAHYAVMHNVSLTNDICSKVVNNYSREKLIENRVNLFNNFSGSDLDKQLKYELSTYLPELLLRQDKMSMANSIENRVPILDNDFADLAFMIPEKQLVNWTMPKRAHIGFSDFTVGKSIFKQVSERKFGTKFTYRKKCGFPIPIREMMATENFREYFNDVIINPAKNRGILDANQMDNWYKNINSISDQEVDALWRAVNTEIWSQLFLDKRSYM